MNRSAKMTAAAALAAILAFPVVAQDADDTGTIAIDGELENLTAGFFTDATREELRPREELEAAFAKMDAGQKALVIEHCGEVGIGPDADESSGWVYFCDAVLTD
ncbi:hypothetical protein [Salinarimonas ramus]|uniref:Uncharacterized protein n=1 Tax=Salinarimonas ramus TaxID=690164 RepID=A0A917V358_9HYPH|nr:hypothetical protein [Salinarimonas ramus]GGK28289.1 hypothetical protein GCM10011322_13500 [Salinarimonas ramus]